MKSTTLLALTLTAALTGISGIAQAQERNDRHDRVRDTDRIAHRAHDHGSKRHADRGCFACRVEARLDRQTKRIRQGVRSGELTRYETRKLRKRQRRLHDKAHSLARNGFSRHERRKMRNLLDDASSSIYRAKHNRYARSEHRRGRAHDGPRLSYMDFFYYNW